MPSTLYSSSTVALSNLGKILNFDTRESCIFSGIPGNRAKTLYPFEVEISSSGSFPSRASVWQLQERKSSGRAVWYNVI